MLTFSNKWGKAIFKSDPKKCPFFRKIDFSDIDMANK